MSHQFSFLQVFADYCSALNPLSIALKRNKLLKSLRGGFWVEYERRVQIICGVDTGKFQAQILQIFRYFQQILPYFIALMLATLERKSLVLIFVRKEKILIKQYIHWGKKILNKLETKLRSSNILYDNYIVQWLCKYLLMGLGLSSYKFCLICNLQPNIYQTSIAENTSGGVIIKAREV
jgi:hypothetical protein